MVGGNSEIGSSALRLLVVACVAAAAAGATAWMLLGQQQPARDHDADRRALEIRAQELTARALAPGSPLACLDAVVGETVEAACEKALFASPATVAAASAYAAARLELVSEMVDYVNRGGADVDGMLRPLQRSLEMDSYGFLAHALAVRDGCTGQECKALDVLRDASRVRLNLSGQTLERYLDRYATAWAQAPDIPVPVADAGAIQPAAAAQPGAPGQKKVVVNIDFPTSASIPPVSIMNPEPGTKPTPPAAGAAPAAAAPSKRTRKQATSAPPAQAAAAPKPPAETLSPAGQADPVWAPVSSAPPAAPAQAAAPSNAPAANFASGTAPLPLAPSPR